MKNRYKILLLCLATFFMMFLSGANEVLAYGIGYSAWRQDVDGDGKPDLVFRRYSVATNETVEDYTKQKSTSLVYKSNGTTYKYSYNGRNLTSKWIYVEPKGIYKPLETEYSTVGYNFHTSLAGSYTLAYDGDKVTAMRSLAITSSNLDSLSAYFDNSLTVDLQPVINDTTKKGTISSSIFEVYGVNSVINDKYSWGTGINMSSISPKDKMVYRYAVVNYDGKNVYIEDRVIYHEDLKKLRTAMIENENKITDNILYISDIVISDAKYDNGGYEVAKTASQFFTQYKKYGYTNDFWPTSVTGTSTDASRSVINVFDNLIQLPQTSKKNIVIRHTNLGQTTTLSASTFSNGKRLFTNNATLKVKDNYDSVDYSLVSSSGSGLLQVGSNYYTFEEIYIGNIDVHKYIEKSALGSYACLGYNVSAAPSFKEALTAIGKNIQRGKYTEGSTVELDGLVEESEEECIVIDFYYTEAIDVIYVNHLFVDKNNVVLPEAKQSIRANKNAYIGAPDYDIKLNAITPSYNSLESNEYVVTTIQEQYYRKKDQKILVKTAFSLLDERLQLINGVNYKGYEMLSVYTPFNRLVGREVNPKKDWYKPFDIVLGVVVPNNAVQVNFYYYNKDKDEVAIPEKLTDMKYFLMARVGTKEYKGNCYTEDSESIMSVPSGSDTKQGLTNVPTVMVSAINLEKVDPVFNTHSVNVIATYTCGLDFVNLNTIIGYNFGYYKVTELVADGLEKITLYDDTSNRMFNTSTKTFNYNYGTPSGMGLELSAANAISATASDINDWRNYVDVVVSDGYGNKVTLSGLKYLANITHTFLTVSQLATVDANLDGKVTDGILGDKNFVDAENFALEGVKNAAKLPRDATWIVYDTAKDVREGAEDVWRDAQNNVNNIMNSDNLLVLATLPAALAWEATTYAAYLPTVAAETAAWLAYEAADVAYQLALTAYNLHCNYRNTLYRNFDSYKALYDEFAKIKDAAWFGPTIKNDLGMADAAGLTMSITVHNMHLKLNGEELNTKSSTSLTQSLSKYMTVLLQGDGLATTIEAPSMIFKQSIYNGVGKELTESDYSYNSSIPASTKNGIRTLEGEVKYKTNVLISKKFLVWDISNIGNIEDNVYYSNNIDKKQTITDGKFTLDYYGLIGKTALKANVYTPIKVSATLKSDSSVIVDQRASSSKTNVQTIQLSVPFTVTFSSTDGLKDKVYKVDDMSVFTKGYYIKFNFDVQNVYINGALYKKGARIKAGTWIGIIGKKTSGDTTLTAQVYSDVEDDTIDIADEGSSSYIVRAVTTNATSYMQEEVKSFSTLADIMNYRNDLKQYVTNICTDDTTTGTTSVPSYFAEKSYDVVVLNRLYDFRITDIKDLSWKSVFRTTSGSSVNAHTGNVYYSGTSKWVLDGDGGNKMVTRTASEIGRYPLRTLPITAYKHTDTKYVKAPKLGYSFSYDMKVTGNYYGSDGKALNKYVDISTRFYYISDDGKTFLEEYKSGTKGIYLFYKNEAGQYVRIDNNGGGYELAFVPNEGYRLIEDAEKTTLSDKSVSLGNLRNVRLTSSMATVDQTYNTANAANNGTIITYYGEYKLPNSTIAVEVDSLGNYNINKPLKNGYIGVIFDITAKAGSYGNNSAVSLSYSQNTKSTQNTSQWDYEGYLGITKTGSSYSTSLKLEGGTWNITNTIYNKIKGTVIMYDIDERAATDYE